MSSFQSKVIKANFDSCLTRARKIKLSAKRGESSTTGETLSTLTDLVSASFSVANAVNSELVGDLFNHALEIASGFGVTPPTEQEPDESDEQPGQGQEAGQEAPSAAEDQPMWRAGSESPTTSASGDDDYSPSNLGSEEVVNMPRAAPIASSSLREVAEVPPPPPPLRPVPTGAQEGGAEATAAGYMHHLQSRITESDAKIDRVNALLLAPGQSHNATTVAAWSEALKPLLDVKGTAKTALLQGWNLFIII